jgi:formylglycine-generating enzyme required for sulfatase activity
MPPTRGNYSDLTAREAFGSGWYIIDGYSDGHIATAPVEQSGVNEWGLFGVGGNVWEWTSEQSGSSRVLSGASWYVRIPDFLRVEYRGTPPPSDRNYGLGFRVVLAVGG